MDKRTLLQSFGEEEKLEVLNLYEKYELAYNKDITIFSNGFYPPNIWKIFENNFHNNYFKVESYGGFEDCERRMISFNNNYNLPYPIKLLKISTTSKFVNLNHKDFLGAILALGIKRNKIGDLILKNDYCYFNVCEELVEFIINNLKSIGKSPCKVTIINESLEDLSPSFKEEIILVKSLRVDSIVSKISRISRGKAQELIEAGLVSIDYNKVKDKSKELKIDERVTIRGKGKYIIYKIIGNSKSGSFKVLIKKYT